jgi:predicted nucleic acid-binding protein
MILLDTSYLIRSLVADAQEAERIRGWLKQGETLCTSAVVWYEFLCGPVNDEGVDLVRAILEDRVLPFTADQAAESARLFNAVGRRRQLRIDAMIASAAIVANATLATDNRDDFALFTPHGLELIRD